MLTMRELNSLPKNVRYQRQILADTKNAIGPWKEAISLLPREPEPSTAISYLLYGPEDVGATEPTNADYESLDVWCRQCEPSFAATDAGVERGSLQFPETSGFGESWDNVVELIAGMRKVSSARTIKAKLLQRDGDFASASEELLKLYRMGELICNGDGLMVCYLTGSGIRNSALSQLHEIIQSRRLDSGSLKAVHNALLQAARKPEGLVQSCRVELFQFGLPFVEAFPSTDDRSQLTESLIDYLIEQSFESTLFSDLDETSAKVDQQTRDQRQSLRKQQLLQLLAGHPKPFDRDETIQILVRATSRYIAWLEFATRIPNSRWRRRLRDFMSKWHRARLPQVAAWPTSLSPGFPFDLFGVDEVAEAARKRLSCSPTDDYPPEWRPLSHAELEASNQELRRVFNPVGRLLAVRQIAFDASRMCFEHYRSLQATTRDCASQI